MYYNYLERQRTEVGPVFQKAEWLFDYKDPAKSPDYFDIASLVGSFGDYFEKIEMTVPDNFRLDDFFVTDFLCFMFFFYFFIDSHICIFIYFFLYFLYIQSFFLELATIDDGDMIFELHHELTPFTFVEYEDDDFSFDNFSTFYFLNFKSMLSSKYFNKFNDKFIKFSK